MTTPTLPPVIGITGMAGSGKSTAALWLVKNHNMAQRMSFAYSLKRMTRELLRDVLPKGWEHDSASYVSDPVLKETPIPFIGNMTPRHLMQTLGTEWGRTALHPDFWIWIASGKLERMLGSSFKKSAKVPIKAVFEDVRFANEAEMIRAYGGVIVRIERANTGGTSASAHTSEDLDFEVDYTVANDGTEDDLHAALAALFPPQKKG